MRRQKTPRKWEDSDETPRLHEGERRVWRGNDDPGPGIACVRADKIGFQGIRRSARRLSDRGGDREFGQEARSRNKWAALGPDVSVDATGRRERDHRTNADRRSSAVACQRGIDGPNRRRYQRRQHAIPVQEYRARGKNDGWADRTGT